MGKTDLKNTVPKFVPDPTQSSKRVYSNFARVGSTGLDFTISFSDVTPPTREQVEKAKKGEEILVPLQCEVVVPNDLVPALIDALREQYDRYQKGIEESKGKSVVEKTKSTTKS